MYITKSKMLNDMVQLKVRVSAAEVEEAFGIAFNDFARRMGLSISRSVSPEDAIKEQMKVDDAASIVMESAVDALVPMVLTVAHIKPAFPPAAPRGLVLKRREAAHFCLEVTPKPKYELNSYEPVEIEVTPYVPDKKELQQALNELSSYYGEYVEDPSSSTLSEGGSCLLSVEAYIGSKPVGGLNTEGRTYTLGEGLMPDGFDKALIGMSVGEERSFVFEAPDYDSPSRGTMVQVSCKVKLLEIQRKVCPKITEEWVERNLPDMGGLSKLMERLENQVEGPRKAKYEEYCRGLAARAVAERFTGTIPDSVHTAMIRSTHARIRAQAAREGFSYDQYVERAGGREQVNLSVMLQSRQSLIEGYSLDAVFRHEGLKISEEDLADACRSLDPRNPAGIRRHMEATHCMFALEEIAERSCAAKWLVAHAKITERVHQKEAQTPLD